MRTFSETKEIVNKLSYKDWQFYVGEMGEGYYLQLRWISRDNFNPDETFYNRSRKWYLSPYMTESELVFTAWAAVEMAEIHEAREQFWYRGQLVFNPHVAVGALQDAGKTTDTRPIVRIGPDYDNSFKTSDELEAEKEVAWDEANGADDFMANLAQAQWDAEIPDDELKVSEAMDIINKASAEAKPVTATEVMLLEARASVALDGETQACAPDEEWGDYNYEVARERAEGRTERAKEYWRKAIRRAEMKAKEKQQRREQWAPNG